MTNNKKKRLYTVVERDNIMTALVNLFYKDERIIGFIKVGSSAYNYKDKYSDIDLAIIVNDPKDLEQIFDDWKEIIYKEFSVLHDFEVRFSSDGFLHGFLLENFLEIDIGFQTKDKIYAKRKDWDVVFDKTNEIKEKMQTTWKERKNRDDQDDLFQFFKGSWYNILHTLIALVRDNLWHAIFELEELRLMIINIVNLRCKLRVKRFQEVSKFPKEIQSQLKDLIITNIDKKHLYNNLLCSANFLYSEALNTFGNVYEKEILSLKENMNTLIQIFETEIFH